MTCLHVPFLLQASTLQNLAYSLAEQETHTGHTNQAHQDPQEQQQQEQQEHEQDDLVSRKESVGWSCSDTPVPDSHPLSGPPPANTAGEDAGTRKPTPSRIARALGCAARQLQGVMCVWRYG
jgi:hypothetical protein